MIEYEISSTANALGDGAYISNVRAGQRDFTIQAKTTNPRNNAILRNEVTSFFNSKKPYKVFLTYLGRTRWFEGYINKLNIPTANIYRPLELTIIFMAATPYLRSVDEFGKNIAAIQAMAGFPYLCNPEFGGAPTGLFEFSENVILNNGFCPRHVAITEDLVIKAKQKYPNAKFAAHPECTEDVLKHADYIGSTSGIIDYVVKTDCEEFIIGTVDGVFGEIKSKAPEKKLYTVKEEQICVNMKKVSLEKILDVLETKKNEVFVDEDFAEKAMKPLVRMLELAK